MWARDTSLLQAFFEEEDAYYIVVRSVEHAKIPEDPNTYVRAKVVNSAYVFKKNGDEKSCSSQRLAHIDPRFDSQS